MYVSLVHGLVLTHQQAYNSRTNSRESSRENSPELLKLQYNLTDVTDDGLTVPEDSRARISEPEMSDNHPDVVPRPDVFAVDDNSTESVTVDNRGYLEYTSSPADDGDGSTRGDDRTSLPGVLNPPPGVTGSRPSRDAPTSPSRPADSPDEPPVPFLSLSHAKRLAALQRTEPSPPPVMLHIGGLFELTSRSGDPNPRGVSELEAAKLAIRHINQQRFVPGYRVVLLHNDTKVRTKFTSIYRIHVYTFITVGDIHVISGLVQI